MELHFRFNRPEKQIGGFEQLTVRLRDLPGKRTGVHTDPDRSRSGIDPLEATLITWYM
jgi:hypothetical protein